MGLFDRPYWKNRGEYRGDQGLGWTGGRIVLGLTRPTRTVVVLMALCVGLFVATALTGGEKGSLSAWLYLKTSLWAQVWRLGTFQFLHAGIGHLIMNMLVLYFFGPPLEKAWGPRRFLAFYLSCGAFAGLCFMGLTLAWPAVRHTPLVGASGGILACVGACAILYPDMIAVVFPIRWVAAFLFIGYLLYVLGGALSDKAEDKNEALSDGAHLGGMIAAGLWLWAGPRLSRGPSLGGRVRRGAWERRQRQKAARQAEIDRILAKVHEHGIQSLSGRERKTLQDETRRQQDEEGREERL